MEGILKMETQSKQTDTTDGNITKRIIEMEESSYSISNWIV